jgi:hypothetical protein
MFLGLAELSSPSSPSRLPDPKTVVFERFRLFEARKTRFWVSLSCGALGDTVGRWISKLVFLSFSKAEKPKKHVTGII